MKDKSGFGKNNFDRLEAAGLVSNGEDATAATKATIEKRIQELQVLATKIAKVEVGAGDLYAMDKPKRLKRLTAMITAVKNLHGQALPAGSKKHVAACLNELISLREGVFANARIDKKAMVLIAASAARKEVQNMITASQARMEKVVADSSASSDLEDFYRNAAAVIEKYAHEGEKLQSIKTKAFAVARVPVVPADGNISAEKLGRLGFSTESLGGYPVLHNQIVLGISPKALLGDKAHLVKGERAAKLIREEADRMRKFLERKLQQRLQFVSDKAYTYESGTWFWLMPDKELNLLAKASPGSHVKINRWGFAFNARRQPRTQEPAE